MIPSNQLRQGNIVEKNGELYIADFITIQMAHNYNPVPLTSEILENCGFEKDGFHAWVITLTTYLTTSTSILAFVGDYLYLRQENNHRRSDDSIVCVWNKDLMKIFYLHSLQNLIFSLSGEELDVSKLINQ